MRIVKSPEHLHLNKMVYSASVVALNMVTCQRTCQCAVNTQGLELTHTVTLPFFLLTFQSSLPVNVVKLRKYTHEGSSFSLKVISHMPASSWRGFFFFPECTCLSNGVKDKMQRRNLKWTFKVFINKCRVGNRKPSQERPHTSCYHDSCSCQKRNCSVKFSSPNCSYVQTQYSPDLFYSYIKYTNH